MISAHLHVRIVHTAASFAWCAASPDLFPPPPLHRLPSGRAYVKQPLIGSTCGVLGRLIDFPFDTIKTRLQTASLGALQARLAARARGVVAGAPELAAARLLPSESAFECLRNTVQKEGLRGLYRGCVTPCVGAAVEDSVTFSVYHAVVGILGASSHARGPNSRARSEDLSLSQVFLAGSCGGMTTSFLLTPLELVKCRLQIDRVEAKAGAAAVHTPRYSGSIDCLVQSVKKEGLGVLYRGHSATFAREGLGTGCWFATYELGLRTLAPGTPRNELATSTVLVSGAISGVVTNVVPYPFDTAKSVLQTLQPSAGLAGSGSSKPRGVGLLSVFRLIIETEGVAGLYRGITPALLRAIPTNAAVFLTYESLMRLLRHWED